MKGMMPIVNATSKEQADQLTSENKYGSIWDHGLYVIIDDQTCILENRQEADALIDEIQKAANELWPSKDR